MAVKIRPSSEVNIGQEVYAIGNPDETEKFLSKGIISNKHSMKIVLGYKLMQLFILISAGEISSMTNGT